MKKNWLKTLLRRGLSAALAGTLLFSSAPVYALDAGGPLQTAAASSQQTKVSGTWTLDLWHYSGGYWKVGNKGSEQIRIEDKAIGALDAYLQASQQAVFTLTVPEEVASLVADGVQGADWQIDFANYRWRDCAELFVESRPKTVTRKSSTQIEFTATPVFHFNNSGASLRDYVSGMGVTVPLVDKKYGYNIYSVFGNGKSAVQGLGYYNEDDPSDTGSNAIHPSFITGKSGALEAGHPITLGVNVVDSAGYAIGDGTFAAAGACGLHFEFPVSLVFTDLRAAGPEDPDDGGDGSGTPGTGPGGDPGSDPGPGMEEDPGGPADDAEEPGDPSDPLTPVDDGKISGLEAILDLPKQAYLGHEVEAKDVSLYEIEGKSVNAARAAELGLGKSSFAIVEKGAGSIRKSGRTGAIAVFTKSGTYQVSLTATASNGLKDSDTQSIRILKTPSITEDLGGVQKENRKQTLLITAAQDPNNPITELSVRLTEPVSGESIAVSKVFGGAEKAPANTAHIKYRSLRDTGSDAYYLCTELAFLTKWHEPKTFSYEIRVKDGSGGTDSAFGSFDVAPDYPPLAKIDLEDVYYRSENSNTAEITPGCASVSDGDALLRTWEFRPEDGSWQAAAGLPGFADLSFGSRKSIRFRKTGVGTFDMRLTVKDVWTEETLPEYVSEADYLSSSAEASSRVDNVAPRVSLELQKTESAEIFLLCDTDKLHQEVLAAAPSLKAALLAEGISAEVHTEVRRAAAGAKTGVLRELTTGGGAAKDFRSSDVQLYADFFAGMWNGGNLIADGRYSYLLMPTVQTYAPDPKFSTHTYPFTLTARDTNGNTVWSAAVTRTVLDSTTNLRDAVWGLDADGTYLYLMDGGKTALFDIQTGTYLATLPVTLGKFNLVTPEHIYAFKENGIWRMPRGGGALVRVYAQEIFCPVYLAGGVQFLVKQDLGNGLGLYRGRFDPGSEAVRCTLLEGSLEGYAWEAECLAIDACGAAFVRGGQNVYCFGADDRLLKTIPLDEDMDSITAVFPVWRGDGCVRYIGQTGRRRAGTKRHTLCSCFGVYTGERFSDIVTKETTYPNNGKPIVYAVQNDAGAIGIYLGADYVYTTKDRYLDAVLFTFNGEFRQPMGFPMETGYQSLRYLTASANTGGDSDIKQIVHAAERREDEEERLKARNLSYETNYSYYAALGEGAAAPSALTAVAEAVKALKAQGETAAVWEGGSGSLSRSLSLAPDTTYYYEYETTAAEDILSLQAQIARPAGMGASGGFTVAAAHTENFDDASVEPFFTVQPGALDGGRYRIGELKTRDTASIRVQSGTSSDIRFTVPEGFRAVLSADYEYECGSEAPLAKQLLLSKNGGAAEALEIPAGYAGHAGTFLHASLLEPGSYRLSCLLQERTKSAGKTYAFWLDNLKVLLVKEGEASSAGSRPLDLRSSVRSGGSLQLVSGSFTTPQQVMHYGSYPCERAAGLNNAFVKVSETVSGRDKTAELTLTIPAGREALYAAFRGSGKGGVYAASSGKRIYYNAKWTADDALFGVHTQEADGTSALYELPEAFRTVYRNWKGQHKLRAAVNTYYNGACRWDDAVLYVTRPGAAVPAALQEGRFFEEGNALYAEDLVYSGAAALQLAMQEGTAVRNLKIWSISGENRDIVLDCRFKSEQDLKNWTAGGTAVIRPFAAEEEEPPRVYAKGAEINYQVFYSDYENDPSKKQHWVYAHQPLNDGAHPQAGKDLAAPIRKFWVDGKYTVTHWQEDNTGNPAYDKESNRVTITFYIQPGAGNDAPWVKQIGTDPSPPKAGSSYTIKTSVDDKDKDPLTVTIEVYKDGGGTPIASKTVKDVKPDGSGTYPQVTLPNLPKAEPGTYDIVVTVSDGGGSDVETLRFKVKEERTLTGAVTHTAAWEANRQAWNKAKKGTDAVRPENMFWPGETLVLNAPCSGDPQSVSAQILEFPQYTARLSRGAASADGKVNYSGTLWHSSMLQTIGTAKPVPATVRFTARFADGGVLTWDVAIVFDQSKGSYYQMHRNY